MSRGGGLAAIYRPAWDKTDPQHEWLVYGRRAKRAELLTSVSQRQCISTHDPPTRRSAETRHECDPVGPLHGSTSSVVRQFCRRLKNRELLTTYRDNMWGLHRIFSPCSPYLIRGSVPGCCIGKTNVDFMGISCGAWGASMDGQVSQTIMIMSHAVI